MKKPDLPKRGNIWGILTWRGETDVKERKIKGGNKREWFFYDEEFYKKYEDTSQYIQNQHLPGGVQPLPVVLEHNDRIPVLDQRFEVYYPPPIPSPKEDSTK